MAVRKEAWVSLIRADKIPGGLADGAEPEDYEADSLLKGVQEELEHTTDYDMAMEIAMDHLEEDEQYYDKLERFGL